MHWRGDRCQQRVSGVEGTGVNTLANLLVAGDGAREWWVESLHEGVLSGVHCEELLDKRQPREGVTSVSRGLFYRKPDQRGQKQPHLLREPDPYPSL